MEDNVISIGELAGRAGMASSAIRFYEEQGLISSNRSPGGRRLYKRDVLRRLAFIHAAQKVGLNLAEIRAVLSTLPDQRTPTKQDWERLSRAWQPLLQQRIDDLIVLRDRLASCVGCGCLSLKSCALYNPDDAARVLGSGARYLAGDSPGDVA